MKNKNDIRCNGSGYYDETAFKAIKNTDRGGSHKMKKDTEVLRGDIWEMETSQTGQMKEVLLIQCFKDYAAVLTLVNEKPSENGMSVKSRSLMWVDCGRLGYAFYDKFIRIIRSLSDKELDEVLYRIGASLDLPCDEPLKPELPAAGSVKNATQSDASVVDPSEDPEMKQLLLNSAIELEAMTRERDIYKAQYEKLLDSIINR